MAETVKIELAISEEISKQAEILSQELNISRNQLFEFAIDKFIKDYQNKIMLDEKLPQNLIRQGDIYWLAVDAAQESESGIRHPHIVIQDDVLNQSRISSIVVCALSTNLKRASIAGNVLLELGEANLPKQSVVEVAKLATVDKWQLGDYIGSVSPERVQQILAGMKFLQSSFLGR